MKMLEAEDNKVKDERSGQGDHQENNRNVRPSEEEPSSCCEEDKEHH